MPAKDHPQTNIRLPPERYEVLEAAAFVLDVGGPRKLIEQLVGEAIDGYEKRPSVRQALKGRREEQDAGPLRLANIDDKRPPKRRDSPAGS